MLTALLRSFSVNEMQKHRQIVGDGVVFFKVGNMHTMFLC